MKKYETMLIKLILCIVTVT